MSASDTALEQFLALATGFVVILEDRHFETEVSVFQDRDAAIDYAVQQLDRYARNWEDRPADIRAAGFRLSAAMEAADWVWRLRSYDDGPSARVVRRPIR